MINYLTDLRHAARTLVRARAFTAICVTSLGLGLGVIIAVLLFMRMVLGTPPGMKDEGLAELVIRPSGQLRAQATGAIMDTWSYPDYLDIRHTSGVTVTGWSRGEGLFQPPDRSPAVPLSTMYVSSNYFATIGAGLPLGRGFTHADDAMRAAPEAVISHRLWQLRFGSDPNVIGRTMTVNRTEYVIVGVAAEGFRGHTGGLDDAFHQLWLPLSHHPRLSGAPNARLQRDAHWVRILARLAPATTVQQADAAVQAAAAALAAQYPATNKEKAGGVEPYFPAGAAKRAQMTFARMMMLGIAGIVLLVVVLNISAMMLVRSAIRERDLAVRSAMGASRWRLMQYHLAESTVVALLSGGFACAVVFGAPVALAWAFDASGPWLDQFRPDGWLALQVLALCGVTSVALGLLPALRFSGVSIVGVLKSDSTGGGRRVGRLQRWTAAAQAGLAVPFIVISGVQFDLARVVALTPMGFEPHGLYAVRLNLAAVTTSEEERRLFLRAARENLAHAAGVTSASIADGIPLDAQYRNGRVARQGESTFVTAHTTRVAPEYLKTLGTPLLAGRTIDANDREGTERVVLLSQPLAQQLFPAGDAIGQRVSLALAGDESQAYTVVGITGDLASTQLGNPRPQLFIPLAQQPASSVLLIARGAPSDPSLRAAFENAISDGLRLTGGQAARQQSASAESNVFMFRELITGEGLIEGNRKDLLTGSGVGGAAAAVALVLSALGVYGVIAFMVATRTREIGLRMALGASRTRVLRHVLTDALKLVVPGIAVGLLLAVAWVRLADPAWYPLGGVEPLVYTVAAAISFFVTVLAGIPSARRAASVQPIIAMRAE